MDKRSMLNKDYYYAGYSYADYQLPINQGQISNYVQPGQGQIPGQFNQGQLQGQFNQGQFNHQTGYPNKGRPKNLDYNDEVVQIEIQNENAVQVISNSNPKDIEGIG